MSSRRAPLAIGAVLECLDALGSSATSNWSGTPAGGNDFATRYPEDLALIGQLGIRGVRLGLDWSRLQPSPGRIDDDWREWYLGVLLAARRSGVDVWLALHEQTVPTWFDDEGSFADDRAAGLLWPRWVETAAELFGDLVAGWFPIVDPLAVASRWTADPRKHETAVINVATAWRDSWRILRGGPAVATSLAVRMVRPVDHTVPAQQAARLEDHLRWRMWLRALRDGVLRLPNGHERVIPDLEASLDILGISTVLDIPEGTITDESLRRWEERVGTIVRRAAEEGPERPIVLSALEVRWPNPDERVLFVESTVGALRAATDDGVPLEQVFVQPGLSRATTSRPDTVASLLDRDRNTTRETTAWSALMAPATQPNGDPA